MAPEVHASYPHHFKFKPCPPFKNLHVRVRRQIVADGLDKSLDWESAGYDMPPLEWHQKLKEAREARQSPDEVVRQKNPLIFDCRNDYETSVGIFEGAEPLDTENFRDSWDVFKEKLKDTPRDTPIMTYCTGGKSSVCSSLKFKLVVLKKVENLGNLPFVICGKEFDV